MMMMMMEMMALGFIHSAKHVFYQGWPSVLKCFSQIEFPIKISEKQKHLLNMIPVEKISHLLHDSQSCFIVAFS
jgi:hypothetical protein